MNDNKGITLVELLATITLLSIIVIIIWSVFIQGIKNTNEGATKNKLTQEMNYVQTTLRKIHQTADRYKIIQFSCGIQVEYYNSKESSEYTIIQFEDARFCYKIESDKPFPTLIYPKSEHHTISLNLRISDKNNEKNIVNSQTILSRLKEDTNEETPTSPS